MIAWRLVSAAGLALTCGLLSTATVTGQATVPLVLRPESRLWLEGDSNLHAWTCNAEDLVTEVTLDQAGPGVVPTRVQNGALSVPVLGIDCGNGRMNGNLREALDSGSFPEIRFNVTDAMFVDTGAEGLLGVAAQGDLTVAGATRPIELSVSGSDTGNGALRVTGRIQILMTDFGVEPPTAMLGLLKTKNEVTILFDLVFGYVELETRLSGMEDAQSAARRDP